MPFSFTPGQEQTGLAPAAPVAPSSNNGVPALNVPVAPQISLTPVAEVVSPFAYRNRSKSKFGIYFQSAIFLIFGVCFFGSIWLFGYHSVLKLQISSKQVALDELQSGFKRPPIEEMQKLSSRLALINKILKERASVRTAFTIIEESIGNSVIYNKFTLSKSIVTHSYEVSFGGETNSYESMYQQIEILKSKTFAGAFPKITITGFGPLSKNGTITFKANATIAIAGVDPDTYSVIGSRGQFATTTGAIPENAVAPLSSTSSTLQGN